MKVNYECDICKKTYHTENKCNEMTDQAQSYFAICDINFDKGSVCQNCYRSDHELAKEIDNYLDKI